jgi:uncharacterized protein (UPF0254 family)
MYIVALLHFGHGGPINNDKGIGVSSNNGKGKVSFFSENTKKLKNTDIIKERKLM